ncbi:MAG: sigma-70 family RNA polymerase sigma factor [Gammaproteobacteria bacterium]|nr:sigma-70 family RNA polymerase sigma factor [Gammaproteobacteria bacterium]
MSESSAIPPCVLRAWHTNEEELRHWLLRQLADQEQAADSLHDIFLKAIAQGHAFCEISNPRAWFFQVARNYLIDRYRKNTRLVPLPEDLPTEEQMVAVVDDLTQCLPRVLSELSANDSDIIRRCDIEGMPLQTYATGHQLSLSATKSRIQRARKRLRDGLLHSCKVVLDNQGQVCCFTPREK